jgi:hypothetical protein
VRDVHYVRFPLVHFFIVRDVQYVRFTLLHIVLIILFSGLSSR